MAKKKKVSKRAKKRLLFFGTLSFAVIIYFFITLTTYTLNIIDLNHEKKELQKQLLVLKEDEENLNIELKKYKNLNIFLVLQERIICIRKMENILSRYKIIRKQQRRQILIMKRVFVILLLVLVLF